MSSNHKKSNNKKMGKKSHKVKLKWKKGSESNMKGKKGNEKALPSSAKKLPSSAKKQHLPMQSRESEQQHKKWFATQFDEVRPEGSAMPTDELVQQAQKKGEELLSRDIARFSQTYQSQNRADADWLDMVANRGTFPDRLSALQLRIRRSAVHALPQLRQFVEFVQRKGSKIRQTHTLTKALKDIFLHELLPPKRKLLTLAQRPLEQWANSTTKAETADKRLLMWHFEEELKQLYHQFVEGLQSLASNTAEGVALAACKDIAELLVERPEQEQQLLSALVNKLGHPTQRVGAGVAQCLEETVVQRHPNMRSVVIAEVDKLLFRKNISPKAQRYGVHFLSRIFLNAGEAELALQLIRIYLKLFYILVTKDALAEHPNLLRLLVCGLNRAFPYARGHTSEVLSNMDSLYTIVHTSKFSTALSVLRLIFQIHSSSDGLSDRFYATFYRRLLNLQPGNQQHDSQLFTLGQQVLCNDLVECRVRAFLKRFFQIALSANSAFAAAILLMCHSIVRQRPQLIKIEETAAAAETDGETQQKKWTADAGDEEQEEHYDDVVELDKNGRKRRRRDHGWVHRKGADVVQKGSRFSYDPLARNPLFAGAEWALDYELSTLAHHFHPTIAAFAQAIIKGQPISSPGNPLLDLSPMRFLDQFAFKNPKTRRRKPLPSLTEAGASDSHQRLKDDDDDESEDDEMEEDSFDSGGSDGAFEYDDDEDDGDGEFDDDKDDGDDDDDGGGEEEEEGADDDCWDDGEEEDEENELEFD